MNLDDTLSVSDEGFTIFDGPVSSRLGDTHYASGKITGPSLPDF